MAGREGDQSRNGNYRPSNCHVLGLGIAVVIDFANGGFEDYITSSLRLLGPPVRPAALHWSRIGETPVIPPYRIGRQSMWGCF
jgi:hypothetical protein